MPSSNDSTITIAVPDIGTIKVTLVSDTLMKISSNRGLLYGGQLYSLAATFGNHNEAWYPVSGLVLTGEASSKAPARVQNPVLDAISTAINAYLAAYPETIIQAREARRLRQIDSLQDNINRATEYVNRYQKEIDGYQKQIDALNAEVQG